jgi:hypothetical protein
MAGFEKYTVLSPKLSFIDFTVARCVIAEMGAAWYAATYFIRGIIRESMRK